MRLTKVFIGRSPKNLIDLTKLVAIWAHKLLSVPHILIERETSNWEQNKALRSTEQIQFDSRIAQ